eukprot:14140050-Alexandrium_andersonii.AAC.1
MGLPKALGPARRGLIGAARDLVLGGHAAAALVLASLALVLVPGARCRRWGRRSTARPRDIP